MMCRATSTLVAALVVTCAAVGTLADPAAAAEQAASAAGGVGARAVNFLSEAKVIGGISAGWFYASHVGPDASDNEALLSNFLIGLAAGDEADPVGFEAAFGETSTPSVLSAPDVNGDFRIEFAFLTLRPLPGAELAVGLLQPIAGYEDTYTYNNENIVHGVLGAQQPYNAYGTRITYSVAGLELDVSYYGKRLDDNEYALDEDSDGEEDRNAGNSWEVDLGGEVAEFSYRAYYYHLEGLRSLTGVVVEHTVANVSMALNADYWRWDSSLSDFYERSYAEGVALYVTPRFGHFSFPVRLEYVDQGGSRIYVDDPDTETLWSATVTPTYHWNERSYVRLEAAYARAHDAFSDSDGDPRDNRVYLAGELGYIF